METNKEIRYVIVHTVDGKVQCVGLAIRYWIYPDGTGITEVNLYDGIVLWGGALTLTDEIIAVPRERCRMFTSLEGLIAALRPTWEEQEEARK